MAMRKMVVISQAEYDQLLKKQKFLHESYNYNSRSKKFLNAHKLNEEKRQNIPQEEKQKEKVEDSSFINQGEDSFNTTNSFSNTSAREETEEYQNQERERERAKEHQNQEREREYTEEHQNQEKEREEEEKEEEEEEEEKEEEREKEERKKEERKKRKEEKKSKEREENDDDDDSAILVEKFGKYYPNKVKKGASLINAILGSKNAHVKISDQQVQLNEINVDFETFLTFIELCVSRKKKFSMNEAFISFLASNDISIKLISNPTIRSKIEEASFQSFVDPSTRDRSPMRTYSRAPQSKEEKEKRTPITWFLNLNSVPDQS